MISEAEIFEKVVMQRRSVFQKDYLAERIEDEVVAKMLAMADRAPTHKRTEPWRFVVFTGNGIARLAKFQSELYKKVTTADGSFREDRYLNLLNKPAESSHIIAVGMKRDSTHSLPEWEELGAVFCAIENLYLAATAFGLGGYLSTGGITNFEEAKEFFGLGPEDRLCGFFHLGKIKAIEAPLSKRKPIEDKVSWIKD